MAAGTLIAVMVCVVETFQELIKDSIVPDEDICFYCGGYYKLPGIGGGGGYGYLEMVDLEIGILKIEYGNHEDILCCILKMLESTLKK